MNGRSGMKPERRLGGLGLGRQVVPVDDDPAGGRLAAAPRSSAASSSCRRRWGRGTRGSRRAATSRLMPSTAVKLPYRLTRFVNRNHRSVHRQPPASRAGGSRTAAPPVRAAGAVLRAESGVGAEIDVHDGHLQAADERDDGGLLVEAAAGQPQVRGVGRKLVERRIDRQPQAASVAFVDVDLGPRVVIERALHPRT